MFEMFDDESRKAITAAADEARRLNQQRASSVHLLLALLKEADSELAKLFEVVGVTRDRLSFWAIEEQGFAMDEIDKHIPFTPDVRRVIDRAISEREGADVTPGRLVLSMLAEPKSGIAGMLRSFHVNQRELGDLIRRQWAR